MAFYKNYGKRAIGFIIALIAFIILLPILILVAILIKLDSKGPVIFKQERLGVDGVVEKIVGKDYVKERSLREG